MMKFVSLTFAILLIMSKDAQGASQDGNGCSSWRKLNDAPVCFEGRNDKPGEVTFRGTAGTMVAAMKLVYRSGTIRCAQGEQYGSLWGCSYRYPNQDIKDYPLNVIVTDEKNKKIYPLDKYLSPGWPRPGLWYYLPGTNSVTSKELVFTNYLDPFYLSPGGKLKIWYGEDLKNWHESDNVGRVCVDVYIAGR